MRADLSLLFIATFLPLLTTAKAPPPLLRAQLNPLHPYNPLLPRDPNPQAFCDGIDCGNFCIPNGYHCCSDGGAGCPIGSVCIPNGCCPNGETCEDGGGTLTFPGGQGGAAPTSFQPAPTLTQGNTNAFSSDSFSLVDSSSKPVAASAKQTAGAGAATTSENAYDSYLATASPGGGGAVSGISFPSFSQPTFVISGVSGGNNLPSATAAASSASTAAGAKSGGSSGGGSGSGVAAGAGRVGGFGVAVTGVLMVGGLVVVWIV